MLYHKQIVKYKIESMYFSFMFGEEVFVQSNTKEQMIFHRFLSPEALCPVLVCTSEGYTRVGEMLYHSSGYIMFSPQKFELSPQVIRNT